MKANQRLNQILKFINRYLSAMPAMSRVTFYELVPHICESFEKSHNYYCSPSTARALITEALRDREQDFIVLRGRGICKSSVDRLLP